MTHKRVSRETIDRALSLVLCISRNLHAHEEARELVPIAELIQNNVDIIVEGDFNDNLLPYLVQWFSNEFFRWFKAPNCEKCNSSLKFIRNSVDIQGRSVENYGCVNAQDCDFTFDFIRHNDPSILLHTRTGRCGEWAHCFFVILRALNYDARIVYDSKDHVWNEVYSKSTEYWIHIDPCESIIDTPLLYEVGWSKKLEYCIAYSPYEVTDVTRRYVVDYDETRKIRRDCDELWLEQYLDKVTADLLRDAASDQIASDRISRRMREKEYLRQLSSCPRCVPDGNQLKGRKTGGIAWRIERGEYCPSSRELYVINVTRCEESLPNEGGVLFYIRYNCDKDLYNSSHPDFDDKKTWSLLTYEYENVDYKYERDWKTSYIARYESCPADKIGKIVWRFDISKLDNFDKVEVMLGCRIYPGTMIAMRLISYGSSTEDRLTDASIQPNKRDIFTRSQLGSRVKLIDLVITLSGGDASDEVAWQKPQLFRQTRVQNCDDYPFSINFY